LQFIDSLEKYVTNQCQKLEANNTLSLWNSVSYL